MKKVILGNIVHFYDDNDCEIMYIDHSVDDCMWYFYSNNIINITQDMELYNMLDNFMQQNYVFSDDVLPSYKDNNKLIWYSDCHYNPDDEWSVISVSCLNIERKDGSFNIWCTKRLDEKINTPNKSYGICFSPCGNGRYSRNVNTGATLQDDFVVLIYQPLLSKRNVLKK